MDRRILIPSLLLLALAGCRSAAPPAYPEWIRAEQENGKATGGAYESYVLAAQQAETAAPQYLNRTWFTPGKREAAMQLTAGALQTLESGTRHTCEFRFKPSDPFAPVPYQKGWRLLGRALVWKIEDALKSADEPKAVHYAAVATKFGFDLTGGGAIDASLGLTIVDEARRAISPALPTMQSANLGILSERIHVALAAKPPLSQTIDHERENMLMAVQAVQNAYRDKRWNDLETKLGTDVHNAVNHLKDLQQDDAVARPAYFQNFASEADAEVRWLEAASKTPAADRERLPKPALMEDRPWRRLSKHFFLTARPLLEMHDATLARTKLLIVESAVMQQVKKNKVAPKNLNGIPKDLTIDPYTGKPFVYRADGSDYRLYSVGTDFRDDGGESDETATAPDLKLEIGR